MNAWLLEEEDDFEVVPAAQTRCGTQRGPP
jgi:hypothetical protein